MWIHDLQNISTWQRQQYITFSYTSSPEARVYYHWRGCQKGRIDFLSCSHNLRRTETNERNWTADGNKKRLYSPVFSLISSVNWTQLFYSCVFMQFSMSVSSLWPGLKAWSLGIACQCNHSWQDWAFSLPIQSPSHKKSTEQGTWS